VTEATGGRRKWAFMTNDDDVKEQEDDDERERWK
jgi:hypothetical protein